MSIFLIFFFFFSDTATTEIYTLSLHDALPSLVGSQALIDRVFDAVDSHEAGLRLVHDTGLDVEHPHHAPATHEGRRRNLTITLCGDKRVQMTMHRVTIGGRDPEVRRRLEGAGIAVRDARG